jgi:2-polyprenyl-6-hydroxyphenyl methylase/3-demethylubiquinone-9 3-methyltransferase
VRDQIQYAQVDLNRRGLTDYGTNTFDVIVCSDVLEHLENPAAILREIARVLKPGGEVFLTLPNAFNLWQRLEILKTGNSSRYKSERRARPHGHISLLPTAVLDSLCLRAGLELTAHGGGYVWWKNHFWFPARQAGALLSYVASYHLRKPAATVAESAARCHATPQGVAEGVGFAERACEPVCGERIS